MHHVDQSLGTAEWINPAVAAPPEAWYAIQTRPRHEKTVTLELGHKGITTYLPLHTEKRQWSDRVANVEAPLFGGYVFVRLADTLANRVFVLRTLGVTRFVGARGVGEPIPENQISSIQTVVANQTAFKLHSFLSVGQRVRVRDGSLAGVTGILTQVDREDCVVLSIELIQRSLSIRLDGYSVEPI